MCELTLEQAGFTPSEIAAIPMRGSMRLPCEYGVIDKLGEDVELFATREEAILRARVCHREYPFIRPFRVVKITMQPITDEVRT